MATTDGLKREVNSCKKSLNKGFAKLPEVLSELGFEALKEGQDEAVMNLLFGRDTICVLPTGFGKSAIYIAPTRALEWKTLIFSPLVSLMQDQVEALWGYDYRAGQVSSGQTVTENNMVLSEWERGDLQFMLVAPERLNNDRFQEVMSRSKPNMVVVDEAHCVSQWADSFRPDYVKIGDFVRSNSPDCVLALTATLTEAMEVDVRDVLTISDASKVVFYPPRDNLTFETCTYNLNRLRQKINEVKGPLIVYCSTRKATEELFAYFKGQIEGESLVYNGGMKPDDRTTNQNLFMSNAVRVMFATNAFGLGVNKPDIRGVFHTSYPGSIEQYAQESGRAGRDGEESTCILFIDPSSLQTQRWFIETTYPSEHEIRKVFNKVSMLADSKGIAKVTGFDLAKHTNLHQSVVSSSLSILTANGVLDRNLNVAKLAKIKILKEHLDEKYSSLFSDIESLGFLNGEFYDVDLEFLADNRQVKIASLTRELNTLDKEDYVIYIPPFRGKPTKIIGDISGVDFKKIIERRADSLKKLDSLVTFCDLDNKQKHEFLSSYFS